MPEKFESAAIFLWLGLPSTLIRHSNRAIRKPSSSRRDLNRPVRDHGRFLKYPFSLTKTKKNIDAHSSVFVLYSPVRTDSLRSKCILFDAISPFIHTTTLENVDNFWNIWHIFKTELLENDEFAINMWFPCPSFLEHKSTKWPATIAFSNFPDVICTGCEMFNFISKHNQSTDWNILKQSSETHEVSLQYMTG